MSFAHILLGILSALLWGGNIIASKIATDYLPPFLLSALRFTIVALCILPFIRKMDTPMLKAFWLGQIWGTIYFMFFFSGLFLGASAAVTSVIMQLSMPFTVILGIVFLKERTTVTKIIGTVITFYGIYIMKDSPYISESPLATILIICAAFTWGAAQITLKKNNETHILAFTGWMALFCIPSLLALSFLSSYLGIFPNEILQSKSMFRLNYEFIFALLYMSIVSTIIVNYSILYLLKHNTAGQVGSFLLLIPVSGVLLSITILGEEVAHYIINGSIVVMIGLSIILFQRRKIKKIEILAK
jgi:O-acetylserine/cysteine efflux transporter